ncbi:glycosyl hydrolase family 8 [Rhizobium straminoryzae]
MKPWLSIIMTLVILVQASLAHADASINEEEWMQYKTRFLDRGGRIIDNGNHGISHSEGQGYGLLLAYLADNRSDFELIWHFTRTELLLRDDGLAAWKWDPEARPHVTDINSATDGDMLIAYALALAGASWNNKEYVAAATRIAKAILQEAVVKHAGRTILLPGANGFSARDREDGPIINPSYWIFEAFPVMNALAPSDAWELLTTDGLYFMKSLQFGPAKLPAEWVSLRTAPRPAPGFERIFGYNSVRIPLYLARSGVAEASMLGRLRQSLASDDQPMATVDLTTGKRLQPLTDKGYMIILSLLDCLTDGTKVPETLQQFQPNLYFPATLQLLALSFLREEHAACL